ncbi:MAG: DUF2062 domain-containing protein [Alphaproteobacteria bacterium]|nr:DUF2062 domain-containing protein [Alphaproteobacteria bacterium]
MPGTPYSIAAGFASGAAMSMTPFIGLHFVLSAILAWVIGGNLIASAFGTIIGNPWTFPLIWVWIYYIGNFILGTAGAGTGLPDSLSWSFLMEMPSHVLVPMLVGSVPTALVVWLVAFFPMRAIVSGLQERRRRRRIAKRQILAHREVRK